MLAVHRGAIPLSHLASYLAYATPFLIHLLFIHLFFGDVAHVVAGDVYGALGMALGWIPGGVPPTYFHLPGFFFGQLSGVVLSAFAKIEDHINLYYYLYLTLHVLVVLGASVWLGLVFRRLKIKARVSILLGTMAASMPLMLVAFVTMALGFYDIGVLLVPLVLSIYAVAISEENSTRQVFAPLFLLGFLFSNYVLLAIVLVSLFPLVVVSLPCRDADAMARKLGFYRRLNPVFLAGFGTATVIAVMPMVGVYSEMTLSYYSYPAVAATVLMLVGCLTQKASPSGHRVASEKISPVVPGCLLVVTAIALFALSSRRAVLLVALLLLGVVALFATRPRVVVIGAYCIAFPLLSGWLAGVNVMARWWPASFLGAVTFKGGSVAAGARPFETVEPLEFMLHSPWFFLLPFLVVGFGLILWLGLKRRDAGDLAVAAVAVAILTLQLWAIHDLDFRSWYRPGSFASNGRQLLALVPAVALVVCCLARHEKRWVTRFVWVVLVTISVASVARFFLVTGPVMREGRIVVELAKEFLDRHPEGSIICQRVSLPKECAILYGFNNYRVAKYLEQPVRYYKTTRRVDLVDEKYVYSWPGGGLRAPADRPVLVLHGLNATLAKEAALCQEKLTVFPLVGMKAAEMHLCKD